MVKAKPVSVIAKECWYENGKYFIKVTGKFVPLSFACRLDSCDTETEPYVKVSEADSG